MDSRLSTESIVMVTQGRGMHAGCTTVTAAVPDVQGVVSCVPDEPAKLWLSGCRFDPDNEAYNVFMGPGHSVYSNDTLQVLRSDTKAVTPPQPLSAAPPGDFVWGNDPRLAQLKLVRSWPAAARTCVPLPHDENRDMDSPGVCLVVHVDDAVYRLRLTCLRAAPDIGWAQARPHLS